MEYPLWNAFLTMMWFFLWILWLMLLFWIIRDIFRSRDLSGWAKAGWLVLVCLLPFLGVLIYLIVRGSTMHDRQADELAYDSYRTGSAGPNSADQLAKLANLRDRGVISDAEFERGKEKVLRV